MLRFNSDYMEGAHPAILERLTEINFEKITGYGLDCYSDQAKKRILEACGLGKESQVEFLVGGTQTNSTILSAMLKPWEGVVAATTGHINVHEAGAVEYTGHKVMEIPEKDGKLEASALDGYLKKVLEDGDIEHMIYPGGVYISYPTEYGTLYSKEELEKLYAVTRKYGIFLYVDGARMGYGLAASGDMTLKDMAANCDAFYIGGTKVGALMGEAVVIKDRNRCPHLFNLIKKHGALLAKGWLLGVQFDELFQEKRYLTIAQNAIEQADTLRKAFRDKGYELYPETITNQIFIKMSQSQYEKLKEKVDFGLWETLDEETVVVRFVTSWATTAEQVEALAALL